MRAQPRSLFDKDGKGLWHGREIEQALGADQEDVKSPMAAAFVNRPGSNTKTPIARSRF